MRIKTALASSILLLAVGAAPALAQEQRLDGSAEVVKSITRDTGLTDEQLKTLLPAQERAIAIDAKLQELAGRGLRRLPVRHQERQADRHGLRRGRGQGGRGLRRRRTARQAQQGPARGHEGGSRRSLRQGEGRRVRGPSHERQRRQAAVAGVTSWYVDAATNTLHVTARTGKGKAAEGRARQVRRQRRHRRGVRLRADADRGLHGRRRHHERQYVLHWHQRAQRVAEQGYLHRRSLRQPGSSVYGQRGWLRADARELVPGYDDAIVRNDNRLLPPGTVGGRQPVDGGFITTRATPTRPSARRLQVRHDDEVDVRVDHRSRTRRSPTTAVTVSRSHPA